MSQQTYLKVPFVWEEPKPLIEVPQRLIFQPVKAMPDTLLISTVVRVWTASKNVSHQRKVSERNPHAAVESYLNLASDGFSYQDGWWQLGMNENGDVIGFVLPVIFKDCAKEGLEEGSIYDIGVVPEYRGLGFANDLLLQGTRTLQDIGVWRIFCDTDANNVRMISTFKRIGYRQYGEPWERPV